MTVNVEQTPALESPSWLQGRPSLDISFPAGIPGFTSHRSFRLEPAGKALHWLQSGEEHGPDFLVVEPHAFLPDFRVHPEPWMLKSLGVSREEDLVILAVVTLPNEMTELPTMNLQGPILVNPLQCIARQVVLPDSSLGPQTPIPIAS
jgi:flagellar assembly factor FliW